MRCTLGTSPRSPAPSMCPYVPLTLRWKERDRRDGRLKCRQVKFLLSRFLIRRESPLKIFESTRVSFLQYSNQCLEQLELLLGVLCVFLLRVYSCGNMPKTQYTQHFRHSWLQDPQLKDWLQIIESTAGQVAKCKLCGTTLRSHYGDLKSHGMSKKHLQNKKVNDCFLYYSFI